jgi:hypothetical protein
MATISIGDRVIALSADSDIVELRHASDVIHANLMEYARAHERVYRDTPSEERGKLASAYRLRFNRQRLMVRLLKAVLEYRLGVHNNQAEGDIQTVVLPLICAVIELAQES